MRRGIHPLISIVVSFGLALLLTTIVGRGGFLRFGFIGSLVIFLSTRRSWPILAVVASLGIGLFWIAGGRALDNAAIALLAFFGAASLIVSGGVLDSRFNQEHASMLALPSLILLTLAAFVFLPSDRIATIDLYLYAADQYLGQPSFVMGRVFAAHEWLASLCSLTYAALPLAGALVWVRLPRDSRTRFTLTAILAGLLGYVLYRIFPAAAPHQLFGARFPFSPPSLTTLQLRRIHVPAGLRLNAMPSLHVTWALLLTAYGWRFGIPTKCALVLFVALTILATLGSGEHYAVDLIASVPFALGVWQLVDLVGKPRETKQLVSVGD